MSNIQIAVDSPEAEEFVTWLNANGHIAEISDDTGNRIDGVWTVTNEDAAQSLNDLWIGYCNS